MTNHDNDHVTVHDDDRLGAVREPPLLRYVAPRNSLEAAIAEIWSEVLLVDRVGIHDDFLELGGDSLLGAQVVARLFERCGTQIPLESLFERGTIAEIVEDFFAG